MAVEKRIFRKGPNRSISFYGAGHWNREAPPLAQKYQDPDPVTAGLLKEHIDNAMETGDWHQVMGFAEMLYQTEPLQFYRLWHKMIRNISGVGRAWEKVPRTYYTEAIFRFIRHSPRPVSAYYSKDLGERVDKMNQAEQ